MSDTPIYRRAALGDPLTENGNTLQGYFILYNRLSRPSFPSGKWVEILHRGAWRNLDAPIRANMNHNPSLVLGMTSTNSLRLRQDDHGVFASIDLPDTSYAQDLKSLARRGEVEASFEMFNMHRRIEKPTKTGNPVIQHVEGFDLLAVSAMPAGGAYETPLALRDELLDIDADTDFMSLDYATALLNSHLRKL